MTITGTITDRLNRLADLQARKDVLALEKQALVDLFFYFFLLLYPC